MITKNGNMTYKQSYDKIIDAYFKDEIKPYDMQFCFCGTLGAIVDYSGCTIPHVSWDYGLYSFDHYKGMESALLTHLRDNLTEKSRYDIYVQKESERLGMIEHPDYENILFEGMVKALDVLKQIHIERGEVIDEVPVFTKRELC